MIFSLLAMALSEEDESCERKNFFFLELATTCDDEGTKKFPAMDDEKRFRIFSSE